MWQIDLRRGEIRQVVCEVPTKVPTVCDRPSTFAFGCSLTTPIELDIHSHSALPCPIRLPGSSRRDILGGQLSFKFEKILKKGENRNEERNPKATCSHTGNS